LFLADGGENPLTNASGNIADIFDFAPEVLIGQPNFASQDTGAVVTTPIEYLVELPPIF
jgi:hypothetical protein